MVRRYEVVLDGIEISDDEHAELERTIQGVVQDFLSSRQSYGTTAEPGALDVVTEPQALRERLSGVKNGGTTSGIWIGPAPNFQR